MMNQVQTIAFRLLVASLVLLCFIGEMQAQTPSSQDAKKPAETKADQKKAEEDPFAPAPAPPLPAGMTGSDANDPRAKPSPGMYDAGEAAIGLKHLVLVKKPEAVELGTNDPDDPRVNKTLTTVLGVADP